MNTIPDNYYRISAKALILDDQKRFLLALEDNGTWELPGGGIDFGESPQDCIRRELKEEMGLEAASIADRPSYFVVAQTIEGKWKANVVYLTTVNHLDFTPSDECVAVRFFTKEEALQEKLFSTVREFVTQYDPTNH